MNFVPLESTHNHRLYGLRCHINHLLTNITQSLQKTTTTNIVNAEYKSTDFVRLRRI